MIEDDQTAQAMAKLPLDYYQNVIHEFFPECQCRFGLDVGSAIQQGVELHDLDWIIVLVHGHYFAFVQERGPREPRPHLALKGTSSTSSDAGGSSSSKLTFSKQYG